MYWVQNLSQSKEKIGEEKEINAQICSTRKHIKYAIESHWISVF